MTPTLAAQELHTIVERLPRRWQPPELYWETHPDGFMLEGRYIPTPHAYLIFVGHLAPMVLADGEKIQPPHDDSEPWRVWTEILEPVPLTGVTILHALVEYFAYFAEKEATHAE